MKDGVLDFIFPPQCIGCGIFGQWWCAACEAVRAVEVPRVRIVDDVSITAVHAFTCEPVAAAVHALKYRSTWMLADLVAAWMKPYRPADVIYIPVPLHERKRAMRGFNQSELLARELGVADVHALVRVRHTGAQAQQIAAVREQQLVGAFCATRALDPMTRYVLVDDVITTGSTMRACIDALRRAGARRIAGITIAST